MMDGKGAAAIIKKEYPNKTITNVCDFNKKFFVVTAVDDPSKVDYNDPYFAIDKTSGDICSFSPVDNLDEFLTAMVERSIDVD